ncbi:MAG TPA: hypothetical protein ENL06_02475, partial [Candidatus Portnoybacteria bacterium]|nr:hypothetical protein [Candidatus Portnoybacteria bacterium]
MSIKKRNHSLVVSSLRKEIPSHHGIATILGFFLVALLLVSFFSNRPFSYLNKSFFTPAKSLVVPSLYLVNSSTTQICRRGDNVDVLLMMDTNNENVVVADAVVEYPTSTFRFIRANTTDSVFSFNNACQYHGKPCQIINDDSSNGEVEIVQARPTPGINGNNQSLGILTFQCLKKTSGQQGNIRVKFTQLDADNDSSLIKDDSAGTDILANATGAKVLVGEDKPIRIKILGLEGKKHKTKIINAKVEVYQSSENKKLNEENIETDQNWEKSNVNFVLPEGNYQFRVIVPGYLPRKITLDVSTNSML